MTSPLPVVSLDLPAERSSPAVARAVLAEFARACPMVRLAEAEVAELCVVVHEACTNVIQHALGGDRERRFRLELHRLAAGLEIVIEDDGAAYELPETGPPDPEALRERGYGLHIMRSWSDSVQLERRGSVNRLRLFRRYELSAGERT
jgi:serine/threonine-protein kinase RsbW